MANSLSLKDLQQFVRSGAAARCRVSLQPAGGEGTKVFPPTYSGAVYATERRRLPGHDEPVDCVLLDSVQSQANRMEAALQQAVDAGRLKIPIIEVDFTPYWDPEKKNKNLNDGMRLLEPVGKVSSLQAPHRIADAILRDSLVKDDGKPFRAKDVRNESIFGQQLRYVTAQNATALLELCPTALVFGMWDSTGPKGGLGTKFERAIVSEIVGIKAVYGVKTSSRIDPLGIQREAGPLYRRTDGGYTLDPAQAVDELKNGMPTGKKLLYKPNSKGDDIYHAPIENRYADQGRPSEANHGNVAPRIDYARDQNGNSVKDNNATPIVAGGVTIASAEQTVVLSFPALRRLRFPVHGKLDQNVDDAARTVLASLGLCAAALAMEAGYDLRSRCLLWPTEQLNWELLGQPGENISRSIVDADAAVELLDAAVEAAKLMELPWREAPLMLEPSEQLVTLVVKSQQLTLRQGNESTKGNR